MQEEKGKTMGEERVLYSSAVWEGLTLPSFARTVSNYILQEQPCITSPVTP